MPQLVQLQHSVSDSSTIHRRADAISWTNNGLGHDMAVCFADALAVYVAVLCRQSC